MNKNIKIINYAIAAHDTTGCTYGSDNEPYLKHLEMVHKWVLMHPHILKSDDDFKYVSMAAYTHDLIEDAQQTYNDIKKIAGKEVADITIAVTDIPEKNRMLRFLATAPKTLNDYRALILKLCDIGANASYSETQKSSMYKKYQNEWKYKRFIFINAAKWYPDKIDLNKFTELIMNIDNVTNYQEQK